MGKTEFTVGSYTKKKPKDKRIGKICPICANCKDRKLCKNRKDTKLMRACPDCKECADAENCDSFYISMEYKITLPVGKDQDGKTIRKSFSGKTKEEAIYKAVQYKKDVEAGIITPTIKKSEFSVVSLIQDYQDARLRNGLISECTYYTNMCTLGRIQNEKWSTKPIREVTKTNIEEFLMKERLNGLSNSILKKDFAQVRLAFDIALDREYITAKQHYFLGKYGIMRPESLKKDKKVRALEPEEQVKLMQYMSTHEHKHNDLFMLGLLTRC